MLLGESAVGCDSISIRYVNNEYNDVKPAPTLYLFKEKTVFIEEKKEELKFVIWNGPGQESFRSLTKIFLINKDVCILVYEIIRKETFEKIKREFLQLVRESCGDDVSKKLNLIFKNSFSCSRK